MGLIKDEEEGQRPEQTKEDLESTISSSQTSSSSKYKASTAQEPKPMSQISGVRRDLSRIESVDVTDIIHLPKYGVKTDRETELGEVLKFYVYYYKKLYPDSLKCVKSFMY